VSQQEETIQKISQGGKVRDEETLYVLWILQEHCDRGTLVDAGGYVAVPVDGQLIHIVLSQQQRAFRLLT
jgi:hypothetical protein